MIKISGGVFNAVAAAALFGLSTPLAKMIIGDIKPFMLAGLLYAGSGIGLLIIIIVKKILNTNPLASEPSLRKKDWPWLLGATLFGGFLGPLFLVFGLSNTSASAVSLLLNLEGVFTALIAWFIFMENFDKRIAAGMAFITAGSVILSWMGGAAGFMSLSGPLAIIIACLSWAIDNNLTKKISGGDPFQISAIKGLIAGSTNLFISYYILNISFPQYCLIAKSFAIGFFGYGLSLVFFVLALRHIGTSRTGAYFSLAPFFGSIVSIIIFKEELTFAFGAAFLMMAAGLYCHLSENHDHGHEHKYTGHQHLHTHDDLHHAHGHEGVEAFEPGGGVFENGKKEGAKLAHSHFHEHHAVFHTHFHYPDIHHEHEHGR
jgi:drug/metabolite transporter (DMT)-like permease